MTKRNARLEKMQTVADQLLDRISAQVAQGDLDMPAIKQVCATMKDLKDIQLMTAADPAQEQVKVVLDAELEAYSG